MTTNDLEELLGDDAADLLTQRGETISAAHLHPPGPDFVDRVLVGSDRGQQQSAPPGSALISGCKAFQPPLQEGIALLDAIQDVHLSPDVTIA
jgi:hypothetical protein